MNQTYDPIVEVGHRAPGSLPWVEPASDETLVLEFATGDLVVVSPGERIPSFKWVIRGRFFYRVDTAHHDMAFTVSVPSGSNTGALSVTVMFGCEVSDSVAVVRRGVRDMLNAVVPDLSAAVRRTVRTAGDGFLSNQRVDVEAAIAADLNAVRFPFVRLTGFSVTVTTPEDDVDERAQDLRHSHFSALERDEFLRKEAWESKPLSEDVLREMMRREQERDPRTLSSLLDELRAMIDEGPELWPSQDTSLSASVPPPVRFLVASLPDRAPVGTEISLVVRIGSKPERWQGAASPLRSLLIPDGGVDVTVLVQVSPGLLATGPLEQQIHLPRFGDSDPVRFGFSGRAVGLHRVRVMAFAGGTFLSEVEVEVSVDVDGPIVDGQPAVASLQTTAARQGEVTLQVRTDGTGTVFQLLSDRYLFGPVVAHAVAADAGPAVERAISMLRQLAEGDAPYSGGNARRWMKETGAGLWHGVVPDQIKDQFWQLRDHITAFSIATSQDLIPWELLYPVRQHGADDGFLVEQFPVHRRVFDQPRADRLTIAPCTYIVSQPAPRNAHDEINAIKETMGNGQVIDDLDTLLDTIDSGACGALHFACHNRHSIDAGATIAMTGGQFVPGLLNTARTRQVLAQTKPLVFLNACRTDSSVPEFRRMVGWAQQFMGAGAGAFIGTLWPTRSLSARAFAEAFYGRLLDGEQLGDAALHARLSIAAEDPDPTWLAYTVYGDPHARAAQPQEPS